MLKDDVNIAVCLLNYNGYKDTIECVESLLKQKNVNYSIVIVDNCSTNDSVIEIEKYLQYKTNYKRIIWREVGTRATNDDTQVYLIQSSENKGFSAGNNIAIQFCQAQLKPDFIILLNNDTVVPSDFLSILYTEHIRLQKKENRKIALGVQEYNYYTKKRVHKGFQYLSLFSGLSFNYPIPPFFKYICGACIMLDREAPLLDEEYFLYFDDTEYAKKLKKLDYKLCVTCKTRYYHKLSATTSTISGTTEIYFRSMWKFFKRNHPFFIPFLLLIRYTLNLLLNRKKNKLMMRAYTTET